MITSTRPILTKVFTPIDINKLHLPNRTLMSSMHLNLDDCEDAYKRMAQFYALRARGGAGILVTAGCAPNYAGKATAEGFALDHDEAIAKHAALVEAVHQEGGRIALQILHFGREGFHGNIVSASALRLPSNFFTPRALTDAEIEQTIEDFAATAVRAVQAKYDALELLFSQGFLVHQFLAPRCNQRTDRWGGSFDNRARLAIAIAKEVRLRVGAAYPIIFRLPCYDAVDGGVTRAEAEQLITWLEPFGIDLLNVSIGWHDSPTPTIAMDVPRAGFAEVALSIKQRFSHLHVAVSNRINDLRVAEGLLNGGVADVIAMARPFLADSHIVEKSYRNAFTEINTCIACNQRCLDHVFVGKPVGCSVSPDSVSDQETMFEPLGRAMKIAVIGGGVAGLGTALFLRKRGADVTLFEAGLRLGGQLLLAERIPGKAEFHETIRYYEHEIYRLGVKVHLNTTFSKTDYIEGDFDHLVFAHGSEPRTLPQLSSSYVPVVSYNDVIAGGYPITFPVVIIGGGGVACDTAKYIHTQALQRATELALNSDRSSVDNSYSITLLQRSTRKIAHRIGKTTRWILVKKLTEMGVKVRTGVEISAVCADGVVVEDRSTGKQSIEPAKLIIVAAGQIPRMLPLEPGDLASIPYSVIGAAAMNQASANLTSSLQDAYQLAIGMH